MIINILTGKVFQQVATIVPESAASVPQSPENPNSGEGVTEDGVENKDVTMEDGDKFEDAKEHSVPETDDNSDSDGGNKSDSEKIVKEFIKLLPSSRVATQAVQSVSMLVQNV